LNFETLGRTGKVNDLKYEVSIDFSEETRKRMAVELMFGELLTEVEKNC
jgi:hypothetical protein